MFARSHLLAGLLAALLASPTAAKTDLSGCVSSETVVYGGASLVWYLPDSGEICDFLDCGGGRAPPKTTVPGCADYSGTATYTPSFLTGYGTNAAASMTATAKTTMAAAGSTETAAGTTPPVVVTTFKMTTLSTGVQSSTITSAATLATTAASQSTGTAGAASTSSASSATSKPSTGAGAVATAGPLGMVLGLAAGAALL